jgi:hypothetical protein
MSNSRQSNPYHLNFLSPLPLSPSSPSHPPPPPHENAAAAAAVSSKGCSRTFIILFLHEALSHCRSLAHSPDFPFSKSLIKLWLIKSQNECRAMDPAEPSPYGGIEFHFENSTSYWTTPKQFYTWWKNNIERKNKFANLERDAEMATNQKTLLR